MVKDLLEVPHSRSTLQSPPVFLQHCVCWDGMPRPKSQNFGFGLLSLIEHWQTTSGEGNDFVPFSSEWDVIDPAAVDQWSCFTRQPLLWRPGVAAE